LSAQRNACTAVTPSGAIPSANSESRKEVSMLRSLCVILLVVATRAAAAQGIADPRLVAPSPAAVGGAVVGIYGLIEYLD
jgi:hypothetical protein